MEAVVERSNLRLAYQRVVGNNGGAGLDQITFAEFPDWLNRRWPSLKQALLEGRYNPPSGETSGHPEVFGRSEELGVPTLMDRLIQQALHQVMQPLFEPTFSEGSFGFCPFFTRRGLLSLVRLHQQLQC